MVVFFIHYIDITYLCNLSEWIYGYLFLGVDYHIEDKETDQDLQMPTLLAPNHSQRIFDSLVFFANDQGLPYLLVHPCLLKT
jgi:hypothetical protein